MVRPASNNCMPVRTAIGCTNRCSSSRRSASSSWRTTDGDPLMPMSPPGSFFSAVTASTKSPWSSLGVPPRELQLVVRQDDLAGIAEPLGEPGIRFARCLAVGPRPREAVVRHATDEHRVRVVEHAAHRRAHLLVEIRKCHWSGASTTPSSEMNMPATIFLMTLPPVGCVPLSQYDDEGRQNSSAKRKTHAAVDPSARRRR